MLASPLCTSAAANPGLDGSRALAVAVRCRISARQLSRNLSCWLALRCHFRVYIWQANSGCLAKRLDVLAASSVSFWRSDCNMLDICWTFQYCCTSEKVAAEVRKPESNLATNSECRVRLIHFHRSVSWNNGMPNGGLLAGKLVSY